MVINQVIDEMPELGEYAEQSRVRRSEWFRGRVPLDALREPVVGLFPGQGGYRQGWLAEQWHAGHPVVREVFGQLDELSAARTGSWVSSTVFAASPPSLAELLASDPDMLQLAIFGASVAAYRMLEEDNPTVLVGHSLGEIAALVSAGAWSVRDGASIICDRNEALRAHAPAGHGMLVVRCAVDRAENIVGLIGADDLAVGVDNGPAQCVISGPNAALDTVRTIAAALGIAVAAAPTAYGFHNPALSVAGRVFASMIAGYQRRPLEIPVYSPILGRYYRDGDDFAGLLGHHLTERVAFRETVALLWSGGVRTFVEIGAGHTLTSLVAAPFPLALVLAADGSQRSLSAAAPSRSEQPRSPGAAVETTPATFPSPSPTTIVRDSVEPAIQNGIDLTAQNSAHATARNTVEPAAPRPAESTIENTVLPASEPHERAEVLRRVQELFADALEYPIDVLSENAELEAELGVDSMRRTELMNTIRKEFGLGPASNNVRSMDFDTLGKITDYVRAQVGGNH